MADPTWKQYFENVGNKPNMLVEKALARVKLKRNALDLGSGNGRDSIYLNSQGFELVVAVDSSPDATMWLPPGIARKDKTIEDEVLGNVQVNFVGYYDLVISMNSLFFLTKRTAVEVISQMHKALTRGGVMAFNVLGYGDQWVADGKDVSAFDDHEIAAIEETYHAVYSSKVTEAGTTADGKPKIWQTYSLICIKQ